VCVLFYFVDYNCHGATGPTGDQAESKRASSGSPDLPASISPVACRAWPIAIATQKAHFAFLAICAAWEKLRGWLAIKLKARGLALADMTCSWWLSCCVRRATEYHNNERRPLHISRHFCTSSRIVSCQEPYPCSYCLLATTCCRRLLHLLLLLALRKPGPRSVPAFTSTTLHDPVPKWTQIIIHASANSHPWSCRL